MIVLFDVANMVSGDRIPQIKGNCLRFMYANMYKYVDFVGSLLRLMKFLVY